MRKIGLILTTFLGYYAMAIISNGKFNSGTYHIDISGFRAVGIGLILMMVCLSGFLELVNETNFIALFNFKKYKFMLYFFLALLIEARLQSRSAI